MDDEHKMHFADYKTQRREKKEENRERSKEILRKYNISFREFNQGLHLRVDGFGVPIDFWPGTGLWKIHTSPVITGRGVFKLLNNLFYWRNHEKT